MGKKTTIAEITTSLLLAQLARIQFQTIN